LDLTAIGDSVFFRADDGVHGLEVWSSDGATAALVRDDCPGACSSGPFKDQANIFTPYEDGVFYWQLVGGPSGRWRLRSTAGDPAGHEIEFSYIHALPRLAVFGSDLLMTFSSVLGRIDIPTFTATTIRTFGHSVGPVVALGNVVFFAGYDPAHGLELWRSDGTVAGTQLVMDTAPGSPSGVQSLVAVGDKLFFIGDQGGSLWVSDGTASGTRRAHTAGPSLAVTRLTPDPRGKRLLFTTGQPSGPTEELWVTDGSTKSPVRSRVAFPGSTDLRALTEFGGTLFFGAQNQMWRSDGTAGGTAVLSTWAAAPEDAAPFRGGLVFRSRNEIWTTDGTAGGTRPLLPNFKADALKVAGDRLLLSGHRLLGPGASDGFELWSSDGTAAGTRLIKDIAPGKVPGPTPDDLNPTPLSSQPRQLTPDGSNLFFVANTPEHGTEVWSSDGTPAGTRLLTDLCPGPCSSKPHLLTIFGGRLFFTVEGHLGLMSVLPARSGFRYVHRVGHSSPDPVVFRDRLFFFAEDPTGREHLWSFDGTISIPVQEVSGPDQPRSPHEPTLLGDRLYFTSWTEAAGQELWVSDGTADGTHLLADVRPGPDGSTPRHLTAGRYLFFSADDGMTGQELWRTDGTASSTLRVGDVAPGPASAAPADLTAVDELLFFSAEDGSHGRELWAVSFAPYDPFVPCVPAPSRLCLGDRRFEVTATFQDPLAGIEKPGTAISDSGQSGFFWFFSPGNLELVVKLLDGRSSNGHFWVLFGALSDVEYTVSVKDLRTGAVRTYRNPSGTLCGQSDTAAFPDLGKPTASSLAVSPAAEAGAPCAPGASTLCLRDGRFRVEARWKDQHNGGREGTATAVPRTDESGSFWFFDPGNTELVVKALDGTLVNGRQWIFYGALSDVEYWLTVTDTVTGAVKTYYNPPGNYCGKGDTEAL
ncbi:MAG TPA: hypothetical protein VF179_21970, partial [Thermoanaerobaculia bacterium]|nr:hypothetical protein [Thermoanaerobaculia bacterium]